jgi:Fe-S-cluster containining protein
MHMGDYITIEETIGPFDFLCSSVTTGTPFIARVDDDKRALFMNRTWIEQHPTACRFLRPIGDRTICTIHETSPIQCKAYRCSIMQIFSSDNKLLGKVTGTAGTPYR